MITDDFGGAIVHCRELVAQHCYGITDKFIDKIPNCYSLDISYCTNIDGSFIKKRNDWRFLKISGCFFINRNNLKKLNCQILDLSDTIILHEFCKNDFHENHPFVSALKRCKIICMRKSQINDHTYINKLLDLLSNRIINSESINQEEKKVLDFWHVTNTYQKKIIQSCDNIYEIPHTFNPPCFISICENDNNDIETSVALLKKYLLNREMYIRKIITIDDDLRSTYQRKFIILSGYTFTNPFIKLMNAADALLSATSDHKIIADGLFFRKYLTGQPGDTNEGFLGPDYIDSRFFTPTSYAYHNDNDFSFLSSQEPICNDPRAIHQSPKINITWKYIKSKFHDTDNVLYNLIEMINNNVDTGFLCSTNYFHKCGHFDKPNYSMLKYMDIMKVMEKEFMPPLLSEDEWIKELDVQSVGALSRGTINDRINARFEETKKIKESSSEEFNNVLEQDRLNLFGQAPNGLTPTDFHMIPDGYDWFVPQTHISTNDIADIDSSDLDVDFLENFSHEFYIDDVDLPDSDNNEEKIEK